eukprot:2526885-Rhodomonas_salina.2
MLAECFGGEPVGCPKAGHGTTHVSSAGRHGTIHVIPAGRGISRVRSREGRVGAELRNEIGSAESR